MPHQGKVIADKPIGEVHSNYKLRANKVMRRDPTRTLSLRKRFAAEMTRRFRKLKGDVNQTLIKNDALGLLPSSRLVGSVAASPRAFAFATDAGKVRGFMGWLEEQVDQGILGVQVRQGRTIAAQSEWMNTYIDSGYKQGMKRSAAELKKAGIPVVPDPTDPRVIDSAFNLPIHADRVGLIYTRAFNELKGITQAMDQQISRVLAEGMTTGWGPAKIARNINNRIDKIGRTRARTLARTEVIRAHHQATINVYREASVEGVRVMAEWNTAGFNVCPDCADLEGRVFTLNEIDGLIPLHANCRCIALPANVGEKTHGKFKPSTIAKRPDGTTPPKRGLFKKAGGKRKPPRTPIRKIKISKPRVKPVAAPELKWKKATTIEQAEQQLVDMKICKKFVQRAAHGTTDAEMLNALNTLGVDMARMLRQNPGARKTLQRGLDQLSYSSAHTIGAIYKEKGFAGAAGVYSPTDKAIYLAVPPNKRGLAHALKIDKGTHNTGVDLSSVARHEYGHHVLRQAKVSAYDDWIALQFTGVNPRKQVSVYAGSNIQEFFAESFSAYTSPLYKRGGLPGAVEGWMDKYVKKLGKGFRK